MTGTTPPYYGNDDYRTAGSLCLPLGSSCPPAVTGTLFGFPVVTMVDPSFTSTTFGNADFLCLGSGNGLINVAADLGYDRNGTDPGNFNGTAPDVGGRESGSGGCP
jgi:hypothetical protein